MLDGLTATKTADKMVWSDGNLTYTITVTNDTNESYKNPVITDMLNTTLTSFVDGSVEIAGVKAETSQYTYDEGSGKLTITLPDIASKASTTVTFQISKKS